MHFSVHQQSPLLGETPNICTVHTYMLDRGLDPVLVRAYRNSDLAKSQHVTWCLHTILVRFSFDDSDNYANDYALQHGNLQILPKSIQCLIYPLNVMWPPQGSPPLLPYYRLNIPLMTLWLLGGLNLPLESTTNWYWTKSLHNSPTIGVLLRPLSSVKCAISWTLS